MQHIHAENKQTHEHRFGQGQHGHHNNVSDVSHGSTSIDIRSRFIGHECRHALWPVYNHVSVELSGPGGLVWRPRNCTLAQHRLHVSVDISKTLCENLRDFIRQQQPPIARGTTAG